MGTRVALILECRVGQKTIFQLEGREQGREEEPENAHRWRIITCAHRYCVDVQEIVCSEMRQRGSLANNCKDRVHGHKSINYGWRIKIAMPAG